MPTTAAERMDASIRHSAPDGPTNEHHLPARAADLPLFSPLTGAEGADRYVRNMKSARILLLLLASSVALGQGTGTRRVHGIVFDSIARKPLAGAVVEVVMVDPEGERSAAARPTLPSFAVVSDSAGRYEVAGLPSGLFAVAFQHQALSTFAIESPVRGLDLRVDSTARLDLAIPGGKFVRNTACPGRGDDGLVAGYVVSARGGVPVSASIEVRWDEILFANKRMSASHHDSKAVTDSAGRFSLCGVPIDAPIELRISSDGFREVETVIALPEDGVMHRDFRLVAPDTATGAGTIRLKVVDDSGRTVSNGQAMIASLGRQVSIDSGTATIGGLPDGTWAVDVRAIGFEPNFLLLDADAASPTEATVRINRRPVMLAPVSIVANANKREQAVLDVVLERMRSAWGTLVLPSDLSLKNATWASDGIRWARGFRAFGSTVSGRPYSSGGVGLKPCTSRDFIPAGEKGLVVYLDGARMISLQSVNDAVRPSDILAIEAYPDVISAPAIWRTNDACAVVAFWTRR
jgi:hypothetical protein